MSMDSPTGRKYEMIEVRMPCRLGLHMRAAAGFIGFSKRFESQIEIQCRDFIADGRSIIGILCLGAGRNELLKITVKGSDADVACRAIEQYFRQEDHCYDEV